MNNQQKELNENKRLALFLCSFIGIYKDSVQGTKTPIHVIN